MRDARGMDPCDKGTGVRFLGGRTRRGDKRRTDEGVVAWAK